MNKKISKEAKRQGKGLKAIRKILIKMKKNKVFYAKLEYFTMYRTHFEPFLRAIVACMRVPLL